MIKLEQGDEIRLHLTSSDPVLNLESSSIKVDVSTSGPAGAKGEKGERGADGVAGAKGERGEKGDRGEKGERGEPFTYADFTKEQLEALKGEKGERGEKGDAFKYTDFTPEQLLALKGEKGDEGKRGNDGATGEKGEKGEPFKYSDFTAEQLEQLKGEKGEKGERGLQGAKGDKGDAGNVTVSAQEATIYGQGSPHGRVNAAKNSIYIDTNMTNGALMWRNTDGRSSWQVMQGDTGWRNVTESFRAANPTCTGGRLRVRRENNTLWVSTDNLTFSANRSVSLLGHLPVEWRIDADNATYPGAFYQLGGSQRTARADRADLQVMDVGSGGMLRDIKSYPIATRSWPSTLPGVASN